MDKWDATSRLFLENDLCMFFKKDGVVYGVTENGRITYATIKNPKSKKDVSMTKDASMVFHNLEQKGDGDKPVRIVVSSDSLDEFKPIDQETAEKILAKKGKEMPFVKDDDDDDEGYYGEI
jgi:hypothetical protein